MGPTLRLLLRCEAYAARIEVGVSERRVCQALLVFQQQPVDMEKRYGRAAVIRSRDASYHWQTVGALVGSDVGS